MRRHASLALACCALCLLAVLSGCAAGGSGGTTHAATTVNGGTTGAVSGAGGPVGSAGSLSPRAGTLNGTVVHVADGDTVTVRLTNGTKETVRLVGVDTPEVWVKNTPGEFRGVPNTSAGRECLRTWGHRASNFTKDRLAPGTTVTLAFDPNTDHRGYYGRLLAYVYVNGTNHDYALVRHGLARVYEDSDFSRKARFERAMNATYANRTGLWRCAANASAGASSGAPNGASDGSAGGDTGSSGTATTANSASASGLTVADVHADAAGADASNLNDEYVVFRNAGSSSVDLSNATVADAADHTYAFPAGTTLAAGGTLTLHTGSGTDGDGDYYWGASGPIWNNGGDTVVVRAANGTRLLRHTYS